MTLGLGIPDFNKEHVEEYMLIQCGEPRSCWPNGYVRRNNSIIAYLCVVCDVWEFNLAVGTVG
jgi:hypothetical protein